MKRDALALAMTLEAAYSLYLAMKVTARRAGLEDRYTNRRLDRRFWYANNLVAQAIREEAER